MSNSQATVEALRSTESRVESDSVEVNYNYSVSSDAPIRKIPTPDDRLVLCLLSSRKGGKPGAFRD
jgi:hypothetical protein